VKLFKGGLVGLKKLSVNVPSVNLPSGSPAVNGLKNQRQAKGNERGPEGAAALVPLVDL